MLNRTFFNKKYRILSLIVGNGHGSLIKKQEICKALPEGIVVKRIADIRIFCLGYATPIVKHRVCMYSKEKLDEAKYWSKKNRYINTEKIVMLRVFDSGTSGTASKWGKV